jgi:hypothetical protein
MKLNPKKKTTTQPDVSMVQNVFDASAISELLADDRVMAI